MSFTSWHVETVHLIENKKKNFLTNTSFYSYPVLPNKHNHVEIILDKFKIIYNDPEDLAFLKLSRIQELLRKRFAHLGPEPFDTTFDFNYIFFHLKTKKKILKIFIRSKFCFWYW